MDENVRVALWAEIGRARAEWCASPMVWGVSDCALAVMDIYAAVLGRDPAAAYRGRYRTRLGAARALRRLAGGDLGDGLAAVAAAEGWPEIAPPAAMTGDLGLIGTPSGPAAAMFLASRSAQGASAPLVASRSGVPPSAPRGLSGPDGLWLHRLDFGFAALPASAVRRAWCVSPARPGAQ